MCVTSSRAAPAPIRRRSMFQPVRRPFRRLRPDAGRQAACGRFSAVRGRIRPGDGARGGTCSGRRCRHGLRFNLGAGHRQIGRRRILPVDDGINRQRGQQRCGRPRPPAPAAPAAVGWVVCCRRRRQLRCWRCRWRHDQRLRRSSGDDPVDLDAGRGLQGRAGPVGLAGSAVCRQRRRRGHR